jgi:hypothetical protein
MRRSGAALCCAALLAALAPAASARAAGKPAPKSLPVVNYALTLLTAQNGYTTGGAAALLGGGKTTIVAIAVGGLQPHDSYSAQIESGSCGGNGTVSAHLPKLQANSAGDAMLIASITASSVPADGNSLAVLGSGAHALPVACGDLHKPDMAYPLTGVGGSKARGTALIALHAAVNGATLHRGTQVVIYATGLQPGTPQANHIHDGLCGKPSPVRYPLLTLVPDKQGRAVAGTGITDIIPATGVSIHIHDNTYKTIACGNIGS